MALYRDADTGKIYTLNSNPMDATDSELEDCCCGEFSMIEFDGSNNKVTVPLDGWGYMVEMIEFDGSDDKVTVPLDGWGYMVEMIEFDGSDDKVTIPLNGW